MQFESNIDTSQNVNMSTASNDLATTEPSVEEASSRFGVSLRKREPSSESCSSLGSPAAGALIDSSHNNIGTSAITKNKLKLEKKTTAEEREKNEQCQKKLGDVPNTNDYHLRNNNNINKCNDHEFSETVNIPKNDFTGNNLKAQLKKVDPSKKERKSTIDGSNSVPFNFKSRLRKVENNNDCETAETMKHLDIGNSDTELRGTVPKNSVSKRSCDVLVLTNDREVCSSICKESFDGIKGTDTIKSVNMHSTDPIKKDKSNVDSKKNITCEDDDKRKSTGSISSLKKLWEAKEGNGTMSIGDLSQIQFSPKSTPLSNSNNKNSDEDFDLLNSSKKPIVPSKPMKLVSIYATPIPIKLCSDLPSPTPSITSTLIASDGSTSHASRDAVLELIHLLGNTLKTPINSISASQWLQLSDKLHILHTSCVSYANNASMVPHFKFQFRELLSRIETQSRNLRSAGSKNSQDNEKLIFEVEQSLKQISNALNR